MLERLVTKEFALVAFPLYANAVGVRKGSCAALLDPIANGGFRCVWRALRPPRRQSDRSHHRKRENLVRVEEAARGGDPERLLELENFVAEVKLLLEPHLT